MSVNSTDNFDTFGDGIIINFVGCKNGASSTRAKNPDFQKIKLYPINVHSELSMF